MARTSRHSRRRSPLHLPGAFQLFAPSRDLFIRNIWIFGPLYAVLFIFWVHSWIYGPSPGHHVHHWWSSSWRFAGAGPGNTLPFFGTAALVGFSLVWLAIVLLGGTWVQAMAQAAQLDAVEDRRLDYTLLWKQVRPRFWRLLGLYIVVGLIVGMGLCLFVVPGVILARMYMMSPYVMLEKNRGIAEAMSDSARLSRINTGSIYGIIGVMFLILLLNIVPYIGGLLSFGMAALYSLAPALRYQQLKRLTA